MVSTLEKPLPTRFMNQRHAYRTAVAVIMQTRLATANKSGSFEILEGESSELFGNRMRFSCGRKLEEPRLCLYLKHPETTCTFFEAEVLRYRALDNGEWEYEIAFRRLLSDADLDED